MNTQLFIEGYEIELNDSVQFLLNKQFEDISNPTTIINTWSKTVEIPFTETNNRIFGYIYKPERIIVSGDSPTAYKSMGIYFDPTKKLDFVLIYNNYVFMNGYAKMNQIKENINGGTYEITLYGELGKIFQELKKITFDTTTDETDYLIHGEEYVDEYIDRNVIYGSWTNNGQQNSVLKKKTDSNYNLYDIIGWAPNNAFCEGFDYKTYQSATSNSGLFTESLEGINFKDNTGIDPETAIPNGVTPRGIGEYRSYHQLPFIYWNKLFQMFQSKAEEITGYTFDLDSDFFNTSNPDWYKLVFMLKAFQSTGQTSEPNIKNTYQYWIPSSGYIYWGNVDYTRSKGSNLGATIINENYPVLETGMSTTGYVFNLQEFSGRIVGSLPCSFRYLTYQEYYRNSQLNPANGFVFTLNVVDETDDTVLSSAQYLLCRSNTTIDKSSYRNIIENDSVSLGYDDSNLTDRFDFSVPINAFIPKGHQIRFSISGKFVTTNVPMVKVGGGGQLWLPTMNLYLRTNTLTLNLAQEVRSNSHFVMNDLWNKDFNLFDEILKYCKMYRIYVYTDDFEKKIYFKPCEKYFGSYSIEDWTNKLDKSKDVIIKPITFENKYVLFNYTDDKTKLGETYKEKYGLNFGEYRLNTDYNFNDKTTKLFDGIKNSIINTDNVLSWTNLYDNKRIVYSFPSEIYVFCKDKDDKYYDVFGSFFYHNGLTNFSTESGLNMRSVKITDDTNLQAGSNTFFYSQSYNYANVNTYPKLDIIYGNNLCLFNIPKENFTYINNYSGKDSIYSKYWEKYVNERYSIQNKLVTCYLTITPKDWLYFDFNKFIKIDGVLYMVNKIYDYNIENVEPTKVDLVSITDLRGYVNDTLIINWSGTTYLDGEIDTNPQLLGTFKSYIDVTFTNGEKTFETNGIQFTIVGNSIYAKCLTKYVDKNDLDLNITITNKLNEASFNIVRYSVYPYPWIILEDNGIEIPEIYEGSGSLTLKWHGTETETLANKPSVSINVIPPISGRGVTIDNTSWTENEVMIQEGDDEWFRNEYEVNLSYTLSQQQQVQITVVDKEGWNETRTYNVVSEPTVPHMRYTSTDSQIVTPYSTSAFPPIVSNTYTASLGGIITFESDMTTIGYRAFLGKTTLYSVKLPDTVRTIGQYVFQNCTNLNSIQIPAASTYIGTHTFDGCTNLYNITFLGTVAQWNAIYKDTDWKTGVPAQYVVCSDGNASL